MKLPCTFSCRDVDFEDVTETEQSRFCIQRINKIGKLQASKTVAANKLQANHHLATLSKSSHARRAVAALCDGLCDTYFNSSRPRWVKSFNNFNY